MIAGLAGVSNRAGGGVVARRFGPRTSTFGQKATGTPQLPHLLFQGAKPTRKVADVLGRHGGRSRVGSGLRFSHHNRFPGFQPSGPLFQIVDGGTVPALELQQAVNGPDQIAQIAEPTHRRPHPEIFAVEAILHAKS